MIDHLAIYLTILFKWDIQMSFVNLHLIRVNLLLKGALILELNPIENTMIKETICKKGLPLLSEIYLGDILP